MGQASVSQSLFDDHAEEDQQPAGQWTRADRDHFGWEHLVVRHLERETERLVAVGHMAVLGEN